MKRPARAMTLGRPATAASASQEAAAPAPQPAAPVRQKGRIGKKAVQVWVSPEVWRQISHIAIREDRSVQALMLDGLDMLFEHHGEHRIAHDGQTGRGGAGE